MSNRKNWLIYGAYGYTGELLVNEAIRNGRKPILAGRNEASLKLLAERYDLPVRAFSVDDTADHLDGVGALINCAGPFDLTAEPIMDACLEHGVHYFDITGEISVFQAAHNRHDAAIRKKTVLCPGVGFDIVPTDCLAALLKLELPDATQLELAFDFGTLPSMGTTRTGIQSIGEGCLIREEGKLKNVKLGYRIRKVPFPRSELWTVSLPWGDVFTTQISTGIPNAIVYGALPRYVCWLTRLSNPFRGILSRPGLQKWMISLAGKFLNDGPDEKTRANTHTEFWGRVSTDDGRECSGTISGPSVYDLTAETAVAIALKAEDDARGGGYFTASMLAGADFLSNRDGYKVEILRTTPRFEQN
jgi:short subunit dehydrogenase-like uncharacterized protein